jgi:hypothetical protein
MRTFLMIAGLAGLLASSSAAFAADGPGRSVPNSADRNQTVFANNDRSDDWNRDNNRPWQNRQQHNGPSQHWQGWGHDGFNGGYHYQQHRMLPKPAIRARLQHQQFHDLSDWRFKNGFYRVSAEDRHGHDVKLIINAYNGQIVKVYRD